MMERFYLKDCLSFKEVELNLKSGLIVFTGASGSGKSVLMNSILASFGHCVSDAKICESSVAWDLQRLDCGLESEEVNVFRQTKKEKSRYFVNNQSLSKNSIKKLSSNYLRHLSLKDYSDFENENLLNIFDLKIVKNSKNFQALKKEYLKNFIKLKKVKAQLHKVQEDERKIVELKEFASFEIKKIEEINPKKGEDEELLEIKKELSKKEKVLESISKAYEIFSAEHYVVGTLSTLDVNSSFFDDCMNELRAVLDNAQDRFSALDDVDVEEVLNRLEELSGLKRRYGSIEEALQYKEQKKLELQQYENIEFTKQHLEKEVQELDEKVDNLAKNITQIREKNLPAFTQELNSYLKELYLRDAKIVFEKVDFNYLGQDFLKINLNDTELSKVSTGEFNRIRLAILVMKSEIMNSDGGILMLDEIDANLSGEESMSVAKVLKKLSSHFQIFVISHQPQLTSMGEQHFLVYKDGNISRVKELNFKQRVDEIARIVSGNKISDEAKKFAKELLEGNKCV